MGIRYYVCGLGYDDDFRITNYDQYFGDFDTYEEAYELFIRLQCKDDASFFEKSPLISHLLLQVEECEVTDDSISCIDVRNEWWIVNPNFKEE